MAHRPAPPPRGLIPGPPGPTGHERVLPCAELSPFIAHHWWVSWDVRAPVAAEVLPHPTVHLVFERSTSGVRAEVTGVPAGRFVRTLTGRGRVYGIKFRPAAFQPWIDHPVAELTGRSVPLEQVWPGTAGLARRLARAPTLAHAVAIAEPALRARMPELPAGVARLRDAVEAIASSPSPGRVADLARRAGVSPRTLQRRFRDAVGVSPRWVLQRYRLHEVLERLARPSPPPLAELAAELTYADQAHLAHDLRRAVGRTARELTRRRR